MPKDVVFGLFPTDDDPADLGSHKRTSPTAPPASVASIQGASDLKISRRNRVRYRPVSKATMALTVTIKYCPVCGKQVLADFDPTAFDNLSERKKWKKWKFFKKCDECKTAGRRAGDTKHCIICSEVFARTNEDSSTWSGKLKCDKTDSSHVPPSQALLEDRKPPT